MSNPHLEQENLEKNNKEAAYIQMIVSLDKEDQLAEILIIEREEEIKKDLINNLENDENSEKEALEDTMFINKPQKKEEEEEEPELIVAVLVYDPSGKMLAYSIGRGSASDTFHDISHLNINKNDFSKDMLATIRAGGIGAVEEKYPGSRTYQDSMLAKFLNQISKDLYGDDIGQRKGENARVEPANKAGKNEHALQDHENMDAPPLTALSDTITQANKCSKSFTLDIGNSESPEIESNDSKETITPLLR
ncbi:hypothetical protein DGG96_18885 [Legionella qingyii]|uniref:Uncharacterized protein n=1 Tax=Legionella qingyii TaxID=2184757 RepID=A0A317TYF2_9GAMM|nr:hypothetical protein [Legionella qingyii]PWY54068.1 hypothetical protein DGG96_18885 [Legionella qingyii]RUR19896.1 hypothetical protein ELY20_15370 [Legionella qingyii]RUR22369.1 hypothetical protein ELY16_15080 [Legionella qingyii]